MCLQLELLSGTGECLRIVFALTAPALLSQQEGKRGKMIFSGGQYHQENGAVVGRAALQLGDCFRAGSQKAGVPESEHCNFLSLATLLGFSKLPIARAS